MAKSTTKIPGFLTPAEAAKKIGISPERVRRIALEGGIASVKLSPRVVLFPADAVERYVRVPVGNPNFVRKSLPTRTLK